jgi:hypothetical protein
LTKAVGETESKVGEQLPDILPFKELFTSKLQLDTKEDAEPDTSAALQTYGASSARDAMQLIGRGQPVFFNLLLEIQPKVRLIRFSRILNPSTTTALSVVGPPLGKTCANDGSCSFEVLPTQEGKESPGPAYEISGRIALPKAEAGN